MDSEICTQLKELEDSCPVTRLTDTGLIRLEPGEILFRQGEIPSHLHILLSGKLKAYITSPQGSGYLISIHNPGELTGEAEILDGKPCKCTVEAIAACRLMKIGKQDYIEWMKSDIKFSLYVNQMLCRKVYAMAQKASSDVLFTLQARFLSLVRYASLEFGMENTPIPIDKELIAGQMGTSVRSVNRVIKELENQNVISYRNGKVLLLP